MLKMYNILFYDVLKKFTKTLKLFSMLELKLGQTITTVGFKKPFLFLFLSKRTLKRF
jgi:hypothetical protein